MKTGRTPSHKTNTPRPAILRVFALLLALTAATATTFITPSTPLALEDPELEFFTLTTPHFYVHYYSGLEDLARRTALLAEEAHTTLVPLLDWVPRGRTHINVTDKLDTANGSARVFMRNEINIYGMAPGPESVLGNYDDWLRILVYHEYVHILHLDTNPGLSQFVNLFIGKQLHPNHILPRWYTEGIAVYYESARTGTGRINSSLFQMWLRAAALEDQFFTLGQTSALPTQWPSGSAAYLYGGFFIDYIARHHGEDFIRDFNHIYGRRVIPFSLNDTARTITGLDFDDLWNAWTKEAIANAKAQQNKVRTEGETTLQPITNRGGRNGNPVVRPGHDAITFYKADPYTPTVFAQVQTTSKNDSKPKKTPNTKTLIEVTSAAGQSVWSPDGDTLYYTRSTITKGVYAYQDLFSWHAPSGQTRQITFAERALDPAISPDGTKIAYVRNRKGTTELVWRVLDDIHTANVLLSGLEYDWKDNEHWQQLSQPAFTPDGRSIVLSRWRLDTRQRDLWILDLENDTAQETNPAAPITARQLTDSASNDIDPHFGTDGLLYFSSDVSGIFNVYAMDIATQKTWKISNVVNGVFNPRLSEDQNWIYVTTYTADGFDIARFPRPDTLPEPTKIERDAPDRVLYPPLTAELDLTPGPYQAWRWLMPLTFMPDFAILSSGINLSATLTGEDPVGHSNYAISARWTAADDPIERNPSAGFSYAYGGLPVNLNLSARVANYPRLNGLIAESRNIPFTERQYVGRAALSYPIRLVSSNFSLSTSFEVEHTSPQNLPDFTHEPADVRPRYPSPAWYNKLSFGLSYSNVKRYAQSISSERGIYATTSLSLQNEAIGSAQDLVTLSYGFDVYHPNPLFLRHVLALQLRGAITSTAVGPERQFTIGGQSPQDVLTNIIFQEPRFGFPLRGYPPGIMRGNQYQVLSLQYRFPILDLDQGFSTLPVFFRQLKGSVFTDTGTAYNGFWADAPYKTAVGAELQLDAILGYHLGNTLRLGYAHGLNQDAISEWYFFYGGGF